MIIFNVTKDKVNIKQDDTLNRGEYNVTKCKFLFSKEYDGLVKEAIFFIEEKNLGILLDENDECDIPQEAFEFRGNIEIGLYAYYTNNDKLEKRYSPGRTTKVISDGSYTSEIDNTEEITPTDKEQMNSIIKNNVDEIKRLSTNKVDKVEGYNLSENNFSNMYKKKLDDIEQNAQVNKIEKIFINDAEMPIIEKNINITIPTKLTDLKNDNYFVNDKNYVHTDNNFTHAEKEKLKELNNYDDSSLNEKIVENSNSILENKKDIQNLKETSEKNTSNINEFNENLQNYSLVTETGYKLDLSIDNSTYIMTLKLLDKNENVLSTGEIDLPIESMIINVSYDSNVKRLTFYLQNGNVIKVPLNDLISGLVTEENLEETLKEYALKKDIPKNLSELENDSNYVKNTDYATSSVGGVVTLNNYFGIDVATKGQLVGSPKSYFAYTNSENRLLISKGTLENVIEGKKLETKANKVVAVSKNSTDEEYPSAKCTYEIKKDLEKLKDEILEIGEVSDSYIHLEDSTMSKLKSLSVEGVCEQFTTTGKNQLCNVNTNQTINGITYIRNNDGSITASGTAIDNSIYPLSNIGTGIPQEPFNLSAGTYYLSDMVGDYTNYFTQLVVSNDTEGTLYVNVGQGRESFTISKDSTALALIYIRKGISISNVRFYSMLEKGSSKTDYEPYTGGIASPNPDYPQEIKTVEGNINLTSCNKNLFDKNDENMFLKDLVPDNAGLVLSGTTDLSAKNFIRTAILKCKPNTIYTISKLSSKTFYVYDSEELPFLNYQMRTILNTGSDKSNYTFTTSKSAKYIVFKFFNTWANELYSYDEIVSSIQIEEGQQTSLEEHLKYQINANLPEGEFIGKINDTYKDILKLEYNDEDENWHLNLYKKIGRAEINSSFKFSFTNRKTLSKEARINKSDLRNCYISYRNEMISDCFKFVYNSWDTDRVGIFANAGSSSESIAFRIPADETNTYFDEHETIIYYQLAEPYTVDLGIVDMPFSYDEVTNIFTDSDLLPKITATYYKNFISTIRNLKVNNENLKNELVNINNRLVALENASASVISDEESEVIEK